MPATFTPPTIADIPRFLSDSTPVQILLMRHYSNTVRGRSVVKISGTYTIVDVPTGDQLVAAGTEGTDFFLGGHVYVVTDAVATALAAAGYTVDTTQWSELTGTWESYSSDPWGVIG